MKPQKMLDIATGVALSRLYVKQTYRLGAVGIRGLDGVLVTSYNGYPNEPQWDHHAESRLCRKITPDSIIAVVRVLANGAWACARPCPSCQNCMKRVGIKRAYYSIAPGEFGIMNLN